MHFGIREKGNVCHGFKPRKRQLNAAETLEHWNLGDLEGVLLSKIGQLIRDNFIPGAI